MAKSKAPVRAKKPTAKVDSKTAAGDVKLTTKQRRFCEEYLKDFNATQAAKRAGYAKGTAYSMGSENLRKPEIKSFLNDQLDNLSMEAGEISMRYTNIGRGNMSDYMVKKLVPYTPKIKAGLAEVIERLREEFDFEDDYALRINLEDDELVAHMRSQEAKRRTIIRYEMELERNPLAFRIIAGETVMVEKAELDIVKIMEDKQRGVIKSYKSTMYGPQVDLYPADVALGQLAKIRGMMVEKVDLTSKGESVVEKPDFSKLSKDELRSMIEIQRKLKTVKDKE